MARVYVKSSCMCFKYLTIIKTKFRLPAVRKSFQKKIQIQENGLFLIMNSKHLTTKLLFYFLSQLCKAKTTKEKLFEDIFKYKTILLFMVTKKNEGFVKKEKFFNIKIRCRSNFQSLFIMANI